MIARIRDIVAALAGALVGGLLLTLFYEGLPLGPLRLIPFVGPVLEELTDGRVDRERKRALEGFVTRAELEAERARAAELERQVNAGAQALEEYRRRAAADELHDAETESRLRREISANEAKLAEAGRSCLLDQSDLDFFLRNGP